MLTMSRTKNESPKGNDLSSFWRKRTIWRLSGGLAVECSTLVDLQRQTYGAGLRCLLGLEPPSKYLDPPLGENKTVPYRREPWNWRHGGSRKDNDLAAPQLLIFWKG